jgi:hypothetical protein
MTVSTLILLGKAFRSRRDIRALLSTSCLLDRAVTSLLGLPLPRVSDHTNAAKRTWRNSASANIPRPGLATPLMIELVSCGR